MKFRKSLAKYYDKWLHDSEQSIVFCINKGDIKRASEYEKNAKEYRKIIEANRDAIDFFSINDNAFKHEYAIPAKFRGFD